MKELSLNILDIAGNSVKAGASLVTISVVESGRQLTIEIIDDGCGMNAEQLAHLKDPFFTTRTTRKVGLGVPFLKLAAEQTGGSVTVSSVPESESPEHGTAVRAVFYKDSIDFTPLGDLAETMVTLIQGSPDMDFVFDHIVDDKQVHLDTRELRSILGDVSLSSYEVLEWISDYLHEQY